MGIQKVKVEIAWGKEAELVGELVRQGRYIYFKYANSFLEKGHSLSPIKLPFNREIHQGHPPLFDGLFGVFNDSLPDGWGRLLLDRALAAKGQTPYDLTPLDRLSYVGTKGAGALTYHPVFDDEPPELPDFSLDLLAQEATQVLEGESGNLIDELYRIGGSSGGARPKVNVGYNPKADRLVQGVDFLPDGYEHWLIKFPSKYDRLDIAHTEYAYYLMALAADVEMMPCRLFEGYSGRRYFGTQRFDRVGNKRLHLHSASGLMHDEFQHSQMDYGHLMDASFQLERKMEACEKVFRLAAFNILSHNQDDHSKNFAFLMDRAGKWRFAPAYDLTFSSTAYGMHSTMTAGEYKAPSRKQLLQLAETFGIRKAASIIEEVKEAIKLWPDFAVEAKVSRQSTQIIQEALVKIREGGF